MVYRVRLTYRAERDLSEISDWVISRAPLQGERWLRRLLEAILSLGAFPARNPVKPEVSERDRPVRQMLFGRGSHHYRIYYEVAADSVRVLHIRHGAQRLPKKL